MSLDSTDTKSALSSIGVLGGLLALIPGLGQIATFAGFLPQITPVVQTIIASVGALIGIYGRIRATKQISGVL